MNQLQRPGFVRPSCFSAGFLDKTLSRTPKPDPEEPRQRDAFVDTLAIQASQLVMARREDVLESCGIKAGLTGTSTSWQRQDSCCDAIASKAVYDISGSVGIARIPGSEPPPKAPSDTTEDPENRMFDM